MLPFFVRERRSIGMSVVIPQKQEWNVLSFVLHRGTISPQMLSGMLNIVKDT
jgi:hypothetical protein